MLNIYACVRNTMLQMFVPTIDSIIVDNLL